MENENKRSNNTKVDEEQVMAIIAKSTTQLHPVETPKESLEEKPIVKEKSKPKKILDAGYGERFLNSHSMTRRGEKSIYIRQEHHERLSRIIQVIGEEKIPLYAYLDNILEHHFEMFEKAITEDFNKKYKPIF
ncbi:DUF3408 domain-containing protein [Chryseobacterium sp. ERMR1:04]|uniref:DUF3408 domain-containing protein n=1 Tax=Chryseobacterium sp. ERMR1:04 TaxID=1705393 RepID=UPI0006C8739B|nr:DUF3408 domain-containing protein [Chryseobacterium sp. ERMR1:04]KPH13329.1 conjugal transfer protein TraB [Chryseobacterium sp. ERMR1:04]